MNETISKAGKKITQEKRNTVKSKIINARRTIPDSKA
jgi:hypothetical protein